jgi:CBS domain-containing protein
MQVRDVMTRADDVVRPLTTVQDAAKKMKALQTTLLPVATDTGLIGMLTAKDIALRVAAEGRDPGRTPVEDVMSLGILSCFDDQEVEDALATMARKHVSRLAVLNRNRNLVGQFSVEDAVFQGGTCRWLGETRDSRSPI